MKNRKPIFNINLRLKSATVAGRIVSIRKMKNYCFCDIADMTGKIQLVISSASGTPVPAIGDIVMCSGKPFKTKAGQLSIECSELEILSQGSEDVSNALNNPVTGSGIRRQRSLDLMANNDLKKMVMARSLFIGIIRDHFKANEFLEVDTPVLSPARFAGTADAFQTKSRTLDRNLYLRGTLEDYLKQLVVAGFERVFQIGDCFRNESPALIEFTMLEATWAYSKSEEMLEVIQSLIKKLCEQLPNDLVDLDAKKELSQNFEIVSFWKVLEDYFKVDIRTLEHSKVAKLAASEGYDFPIKSKHFEYELAKFGYEVIKRTLSKDFKAPTFVGRFPSCISPLAKEINDGSGEADRGYGFFRGQRLFEVVMEANDHEEQHKKFQSQDDRSHRTSHSFKHDDLLTALSYGCPPMAGLGFNINRVLAVLLNVNRTSEVVAFPITSAALPL